MNDVETGKVRVWITPRRDWGSFYEDLPPVEVEARLSDPAAVLAQLLEAEKERAWAVMDDTRQETSSPEWNRAYMIRRATRQLLNLLAAPAERKGVPDGL